MGTADRPRRPDDPSGGSKGHFKRSRISTKNLAIGTVAAIGTGLATVGTAEALYGNANRYFSACAAPRSGGHNIHLGPWRTPSKFSNSAAWQDNQCGNSFYPASACVATHYTSRRGSGALGASVCNGHSLEAALQKFPTVTRSRSVRGWAWDVNTDYQPGSYQFLIGESRRSFTNY